MRGDEQKLRQVLINLLGNAVKFTRTGTVTLKVARLDNTEGGDQGLVTSAATNAFGFEVIDTGVGISTEAQEMIFQPFQQAAAGVEMGGTGLGLAIAKRQIELMRGRIGVESEPGKGSRFWFIVPLARAGSEFRVSSLELLESRSMRLAARCKIKALVVDDVAENRDLLARMLRDIGCEVLTANDGRQGVELALSANPGIVFMDIRMPVMDGMEAGRRIKSEVRNPKSKMKLVCLSASALAHEEQRYRDAGFDDFIAKPFRFERICECLKRLLNVTFDDGSPTTRTTEAPSSNVVVPKEVRARLKDALSLYNLTEVNLCLDELQQLGAAQRRLAEELRGLLRHSDMKRVGEVVDALPHE